MVAPTVSLSEMKSEYTSENKRLQPENAPRRNIYKPPTKIGFHVKFPGCTLDTKIKQDITPISQGVKPFFHTEFLEKELLNHWPKPPQNQDLIP